MEYVIVAALWIAYCALHSYLISIGFTNAMKRALGRYYAFFRLFYVAISFVLLVPLIQYTARVDTRIEFTYATPWNVVRYALMAGAVLVFAWAFFFNYDALSFFGIRQIMGLRKTAEAGAPPALKKNGLLGVVRHPMYSALIVFLWCGIYNDLDILVNGILTGYVLVGTVLEERKLVIEFGEVYRDYQKEVPMLVPFAPAAWRRA